MRTPKDKTKNFLKLARTRVRQPFDRLKKESVLPELVKIEVTNEAGSLILLHHQNLVGSATEAFIALQQLTNMLRDQRNRDQDMHHI
jgi:hypothetical protein